MYVPDRFALKSSKVQDGMGLYTARRVKKVGDGRASGVTACPGPAGSGCHVSQESGAAPPPLSRRRRPGCRAPTSPQPRFVGAAATSVRPGSLSSGEAPPASPPDPPLPIKGSLPVPGALSLGAGKGRGSPAGPPTTLTGSAGGFSLCFFFLFPRFF